MTTQTRTRNPQAPTSNGGQVPALSATANKEMEFCPLGAADSIKLSIAIVRNVFNPRTKSGRPATDQDIMKFMMLCKARRLNPFEGDAYIIGYEGQDGDQWTLITSIYAFLKRAELSENYDGKESGVIVRKEDGTIEERIGDFLFDDEVLLGGWCKVYRKDRKYPEIKRNEFKRYSTSKNRWKDDPGGMIVKVCEAQCLRDTFPTTLGGMYVPEEMIGINQVIDVKPQPQLPPNGRSSLKGPAQVQAQEEQPAPPAEYQDDGPHVDEQPAPPSPGMPEEVVSQDEMERLDAIQRVREELKRTGLPDSFVAKKYKVKLLDDLTMAQANEVYEDLSKRTG